MKRYTKTERCSRVARGPRELNRRKAGRKNYIDVRASTALRSPWEDPLRTLISYRTITMAQTPGSGYENSGLSDATQSTYNEARWCA